MGGVRFPRREGSASPLGAPQTSLRSLRKLDCYLAAILGEGSALPGQDRRFHAPIRRLSPRSYPSASSH